jgi:hypothetical protein
VHSGLDRGGVLNSHEGAIARPKQKLGLDQRAQERTAGRGI